MPDSWGWTLVFAGVVLIVAGIVWLTGGAAWVGRLPGDIRLEHENVTFYFPITTCLVLSLAGSVVVWLFRTLGRS